MINVDLEIANEFAALAGISWAEYCQLCVDEVDIEQLYNDNVDACNEMANEIRWNVLRVRGYANSAAHLEDLQALSEKEAYLDSLNFDGLDLA